MSLLGSYNVLCKSPGLRLGGTTQSGDRSNFSKTGAMRNRFQVFAPFNATPSGYEPPYSWVLAQIGGGLASFTRLAASGSLTTANMAGGINLEASPTASGSLTTANLELVVALAVSLTAGGSITTANLVGTVELVASLTASGLLTTADMGAVVGMAAELAASISTSANLTGLAHLSADILPYTELSPESLARAVWSSDITSYDDTGTAGKKLNDVSVGGSAWDALIEGGHDAAGIMRILLAHAAGPATVPDGGGSYEYRSVDDSKARITGTISGDTRTISDIDGTE